MTLDNDRSSKLAQLGIEHCRMGQWETGLRCLKQVFEDGQPTGERAGLTYSYYGHALARVERRVDEGLEMCQRGAELEFFQPEVFLNLARTYLLAGQKREAVAALERGLTLDPDDTALLVQRLELGERQKVAVPVLPRSNPINRLIGMLRHKLKRR
jgi:tetratricopeptide (TPR) repeat protein